MCDNQTSSCGKITDSDRGFALVLEQGLEKNKKNRTKPNLELFLNSAAPKFPQQFCRAGCAQVPLSRD